MVNNTSCCDVVRVEELGWGLVWWGVGGFLRLKYMSDDQAGC